MEKIWSVSLIKLWTKLDEDYRVPTQEKLTCIPKWSEKNWNDTMQPKVSGWWRVVARTRPKVK